MTQIIDRIDTLPWNDSRHNWPEKRDKSQITKIVVHQAAANTSVDGINMYHISVNSHISPGRGCPHICYHYTIDKFGIVTKCNKHEDVVWHCKGHNSDSLGICLLGDFSGPSHEGGEPTAEQLKSLKWLIDRLVLERKYKIYGHCELSAQKPDCPGTAIMAEIAKMRG